MDTLKENNKKISCIIPAYNEEEMIGQILKAVVNHPLVSEVIVIDDGSKDNTKNIVKAFESVRFIEHTVNQGKSKTVADGIKASTGDYVFLLDADLIFLNQQNITDLIAPIVNDKADVSISYRKNAWPLWPFKKIDYLSGERIIPKKYVLPYIEKIGNLPSYGLEVFLNKNVIIKNKLRIMVIRWNNVENNFHHKKNGIWKGLKVIIKIWLDVLKTISIFEMYSQNIKMQKMIVDNINTPKISLVICAYNEEKYIGSCLEYAIKNSKGKLFEILVINNASTDKTRAVAESYLGVRVIDENKKGQVRARQRSFSEVKGDIIVYLDADTRMPEGWMDILIYEFSNNPNLVCLSGPYVYYDFSKWQNFLCSIFWNMFAYPMYLTVGYLAVGGNIVIKKDTLDKMHGFDTSIEFYGEDTDIARRASKFGKVKFRLDFFMPSSARRLIGQGIIKTAFIYGLNFFSEVIIKKPATKSYEDIR